jgi:hypothetical protein
MDPSGAGYDEIRPTRAEIDGEVLDAGSYRPSPVRGW